MTVIKSGMNSTRDCGRKKKKKKKQLFYYNVNHSLEIEVLTCIILLNRIYYYYYFYKKLPSRINSKPVWNVAYCFSTGTMPVEKRALVFNLCHQCCRMKENQLLKCGSVSRKTAYFLGRKHLYNRTDIMKQEWEGEIKHTDTESDFTDWASFTWTHNTHTQ